MQDIFITARRRGTSSRSSSVVEQRLFVASPRHASLEQAEKRSTDRVGRLACLIEPGTGHAGLLGQIHDAMQHIEARKLCASEMSECMTTRRSTVSCRDNRFRSS